MSGQDLFAVPESLEEGNGYLLKISPNGKVFPLFTQVIFIGYTSCPAVVVVRDRKNVKRRVLRERLYIGGNSLQSG